MSNSYGWNFGLSKNTNLTIFFIEKIVNNLL